MKIHSSVRWFSFFGMLIFIPFLSTASLPEQDMNMVNDLFSKTKPQCIGRFIIEVPDSFNNQLNNFIFIDDFKIESKPIYPPAFKQRITLREKELNDAINQPQNKLQDAPFIKEIIQLPDNKGVIFDRNDFGSDDAYRVLEAHIYDNNIAFIITVDIRDFSDKKYEKRKFDFLARGGTESKSNEKPSKLIAMKSLISRLSGRKNDIIPINNGLCIPNGFILDDGNIHHHKTAFSYENNDFIFGVKFDDIVTGSKDTLLNRRSDIYGAISKANQQTIKKGQLLLGNIPAQEWLISGEQPSDKSNEYVTSYHFILFVNESIASYKHPWLSFGMNNASKKSQYNQAQMVEIWDRIVNSLRYRPNAF